MLPMAVLLSVLCQFGCRPIAADVKGRSPLRPAALSQDSLVLDIFFIRVPCGEEQVDGELWKEIDEQSFTPESRQRLFENGFRVGRVGGRIPAELSRLLELGKKPVTSGEPNQLVLEDIEKGPRVTGRHLQIKPCQRSEIIASDVYNELPLITKDGSDNIGGKFLKQAQAMLALRADLESDGRVSLCITPEVHHGQPGKRWVSGSQGVLQLNSGRGREVFDTLSSRVTLAPGEMFVAGGLPDRSGSLGHYFFTEEHAGKLEQKLLVIRLSQTQHDDLFGK